MNPATIHFLTAAEIQTGLSGMNPSVFKDISAIEQGTTATLSMTYSVRSLKGADQLLSPASDLRTLIQRNVIADHLWLDYQPESGRFFTKTVYIRPPSLRSGETIQIMQECDQMSAISLATWLNQREKTELLNGKNDAFFDPFSNLIERHQLLEAIGKLESITVESLLDSYDLPAERAARIIESLSRSCAELLPIYQVSREIPPSLIQALQDRGDRPFLYALTSDRHILFPNPITLIHPTDQDLVEQFTSAEKLYGAALQTARWLVFQVEPDVERETLTFEEIQLLFLRHSSLHSDEAWPGIVGFFESLKRLRELSQTLAEMRTEAAQDLSYREMLGILNMQFEPLAVTPENLRPPAYLKQRIADPGRIFRHFLDRAKKDREVLVHQGSRGEFFLLFRANLVQAFIDRRDQRTLLHLMAKENGFPGGIYDFATGPKGSTPGEQKLQEELTLSIRRWEEDRRKEILKQERAKKSFFRRVSDWILSLFGIRSEAPVIADRINEPRETVISPRVRHRRPQAPPERRRAVPPRVEQAISFIERKFDGLIWIDDVVEVLASPNMNADAIGDILFYDRDQRFKEIRALSKVRRLFIRMDLLEDPAWLERTIQELESRSRMPHHLALLEYLKKDED